VREAVSCCEILKMGAFRFGTTEFTKKIRYLNFKSSIFVFNLKTTFANPYFLQILLCSSVVRMLLKAEPQLENHCNKRCQSTVSWAVMVG
jgi:hypothetical protein